MMKKNRLLGLMAGISVGFAAWGSVRLPENDAASVRHGSEKSFVQTAENVSEQESRVTAAKLLSETQTQESSGTEIPAELKNLHAQSAVLMDADSGRILFGKNETEIRPMASTTKIMTCILALEEADPERVCVVSQSASAQPKVRLGAPKGTEFRLNDLLYSLMLESHNDSAVMIAEAVAGSAEAFARRMNDKAFEIGCKDTYFITPNGLDRVQTLPDGTQKTHATTAKDLAWIMRYCITQSPAREEFLKITQTMDYGFSDLNGRQYYSCTNHNALLSMLPGMISGKTGFTGGAGYSYVGAYENDGRKYIIALLGCGWPPHKTYKWADARSLFAYGADNYRYVDIFKKQPDRILPVQDGVGDFVKLRAQSTKAGEDTYRILLSDADRVEVKTRLPDTVTAPVKAGEKLGETVYYLNGEPIRTDPIYALENVKKWTFHYCLVQILHKMQIFGRK
jgi:D-alanyl-D-alanine carboxypeptidase (penicillin-binding protein 5/6)